MLFVLCEILADTLRTVLKFYIGGILYKKNIVWHDKKACSVNAMYSINGLCNACTGCGGGYPLCVFLLWNNDKWLNLKDLTTGIYYILDNKGLTV